MLVRKGLIPKSESLGRMCWDDSSISQFSWAFKFGDVGLNLATFGWQSVVEAEETTGGQSGIGLRGGGMLSDWTHCDHNVLVTKHATLNFLLLASLLNKVFPSISFFGTRLRSDDIRASSLSSPTQLHFWITFSYSNTECWPFLEVDWHFLFISPCSFRSFAYQEVHLPLPQTPYHLKSIQICCLCAHSLCMNFQLE